MDDDEIEFLDSVNESTRAKENTVKKETAEQLRLFRDQQVKNERAAAKSPAQDEPAQQSAMWSATSKKRKRDKAGQALPGVKLRKASSTGDSKAEVSSSPEGRSNNQTSAIPAGNSAVSPVRDSERAALPSEDAPAGIPKDSSPPSPPAAGLGLGGYSSDED